MRVSAAPLVAALLLAAWAGNAQVVRGTAITPDSVLIPGVIVTLLDEKGTPRRRHNVRAPPVSGSGVLTIDRASSELRRLDFSFVHTPTMDVAGVPGGEMLFRRLPEGGWLIEQWAIWLPVDEQRTEYAPSIGVPIVAWHASRGGRHRQHAFQFAYHRRPHRPGDLRRRDRVDGRSASALAASSPLAQRREPSTARRS